jgi:hypothetical protein
MGNKHVTLSNLDGGHEVTGQTIWKYSKAEKKRRYDAMMRGFEHDIALELKGLSPDSIFHGGQFTSAVIAWQIYGDKKHRPTLLRDSNPFVADKHIALGKLHDALQAKLDKTEFDHALRLGGIGVANIKADTGKKTDGILLATQVDRAQAFAAEISQAGHELANKYARYESPQYVLTNRDFVRRWNRKNRARQLVKGHRIQSDREAICLPASMTHNDDSVSPTAESVTQSPAVSGYANRTNIWVKFEGKPCDETRAWLKDNGFRYAWHKQAWWARTLETVH